MLETAWLSNLVHPALANHAHAAVVLQPAPHRIASAHAHKTTTHPSNLTLRVTPNRHGRRNVAHHTYPVTLRLWVTYTPTAGNPYSVGIYNLHLGCRTHITIHATPGDRTHIKAPARPLPPLTLRSRRRDLRRGGWPYPRPSAASAVSERLVGVKDLSERLVGVKASDRVGACWVWLRGCPGLSGSRALAGGR